MVKSLRLKFIIMGGRRKKESMFELMRQWEECDEDRISFCKSNGLALATFSYWRTKYRKSQEASASRGFVELKPISSLSLEIIYPNGVIIRLPQSSSLSDLKALVQLI
jgi:hypothetical protein